MLRHLTQPLVKSGVTSGKPNYIIFEVVCIISIFGFKLLTSLEISGLPVLEDSCMMMLGIASMKSCLLRKYGKTFFPKVWNLKLD